MKMRLQEIHFCTIMTTVACLEAHFFLLLCLSLELPFFFLSRFFPETFPLGFYSHFFFVFLSRNSIFTLTFFFNFFNEFSFNFFPSTSFFIFIFFYSFLNRFFPFQFFSVSKSFFFSLNCFFFQFFIFQNHFFIVEHLPLDY